MGFGCDNEDVATFLLHDFKFNLHDILVSIIIIACALHGTARESACNTCG